MNDAVEALEARLAVLESELSALRGGNATDRGSPAVPRPSADASPAGGVPTSDRRGVVKLLAASAVGAVAGGALYARPAAAADGDAVLQGDTNEASTATILHATDESALVPASDNGYGLVSDGSAGNALFVAAGDPPVGGPANAGTLWVDGDGNWWASTATDPVDGQWRMLAGQTSTGALHLLAAPRRVYDSRPGEPPAIEPKAPLEPNLARTIDVTGNSSGVPTVARGALITLTITGPVAPGYATVWPSGAWPGTSNINFFTGENVANTTVVGLSGATFQLLASVATNVVIDVVGVYV